MKLAQARWPLTVSAIGIAQIISWGTLYYAIAVLAGSIQTDTRYSEVQVFGAYTAALMASGLAAPLTGTFIDRHGGRLVMSAGSVVAAIGLVVLGTSNHYAWFLVGWILAGLAMSACLYEAAFATLVLCVAENNYRRAVTALTLFGGFASTVFWPATQWLQVEQGWRNTCLLYAACHLLVCLPLHWWAIPGLRGNGPPPERSPSASLAAHPHRERTRSLGLLSFAFAANAFVFSVMSAYVIRMLEARGVGTAHAILLASMIGPVQVVARILEFALGRHVGAIGIGTVSFAMLCASLLIFSFIQGPDIAAIGFILLYGAANGIMTIARGTVPAFLFGRERYGLLLGRLARPSFIAKAVAPGGYAVLLASGLGLSGGILLLTATATAGWLAYSAGTGSRETSRSS